MKAASTNVRARDARALVASVFFVEIGSAVLLIGFPIFVLDRYGLALEGALALGLRYLPGIFLGPWINYQLRRVSPRILASIATALIALVAISIIFTNELWQVQALSLCLGLLSTVDVPARLSMRSWVNTPGTEMILNSRIVTVERIAITIGPLFAAGLIAFVGIDGVFVVQAAVAIPAILFLISVRRPPSASTDRQHSGDSEGIYSRIHLLLANVDGTIVAYSVTALIYMAGVGVRSIFLPIHSDGSSTLLGVYTAAFAIGGIAGGIIAARLRGNREVLYLLTSVLEGVSWLIIAIGVPLPVQIMLLVIGGFFESAATAVFLTAIQNRLRPESIGPYYGWLIPTNDAFIFLGIIAAGLTAHFENRDAILAILIAVFSTVPVLVIAKTFVLPLFKHPISVSLLGKESK